MYKWKRVIDVFHRRTRKRDTNICPQVTDSQADKERGQETGMVKKNISLNSPLSVNSISKDFFFVWFHDLCGRWYYSLLILCWPVAKLQKSFGGDEEDFSYFLDSKKYISRILFYEILWFCNMRMSDSVYVPYLCVVS